MRVIQITTKSMHPDLLPSKQVISTFKDAEYDLEIDFEIRRAVRIAARPSPRLGDYRKAPYWVPLEDVKDWHELEAPAPALPGLAKGKAAAP